MKELLRELAAALNVYLPRLFAVIAAPRVNVLRLVREPKDPLASGLGFVAVTLGVVFLLQAPLLPDDRDFATVAGIRFAVSVVSISAFSAALVLTFKLIGGRGSFRDTLVASFYVISPPVLLLVLCRSIAIGLTVGTELQAVFMTGGDAGDAAIDAFIAENVARSILLLGVLLVMSAAPILWFLWCWRVFSILHGLGTVRSAIAYVVAFVLFLLIGHLENALIAGTFGGDPPPWL